MTAWFLVHHPSVLGKNSEKIQRRVGLERLRNLKRPQSYTRQFSVRKNIPVYTRLFLLHKTLLSLNDQLKNLFNAGKYSSSVLVNLPKSSIQ